MERADWLEGGLGSAQARFLMARTIANHAFGSPAPGECELRRLFDELMEIDASLARILVSRGDSRA
jgi:hypothetical protein